MPEPVFFQCPSLDQETTIHLQRVIQTGREEERIDLKRELALNNGRERAELAKDVSAIANTPGEERGFIIIGVCDAGQRESDRLEDHLIDFTIDGDIFLGQVVQTLARYLDVPPKIHFHLLTHLSGNKVGVIEIPRSFSRPHTIRRTGAEVEEHQVWIRRGPYSFTATPRELEEMYRDLRRWILINFSTHPISDSHKEQIRRLGHGAVEQLIEIPVEMDNHLSFNDQVAELIERTGLTSHQWQIVPILINLPGFAPAAAVLLAQLHGRMGHFPSIIRMRPAGGPFEVGEVIDLHGTREEARQRR